MTSWPEGSSVVVLACKGGHLAKIVNGRWLVRPCRKPNCKREGGHTYHVWDLLTGQIASFDFDPSERGQRSEGVDRDAIRRSA